MTRSNFRLPPALTLAVAPLTFGLLLTVPEPAGAQSFNCRMAHYTDEAAICQDRALGRLDDQLNSVYNESFRRLPPEAQRRLDRDEDAWVAQRRQCGADPNCLTQAYHRRMRQLQGEVGAAEQPARNQPPGFLPPPPPPVRPFGGAPVAVGPGFPPPPPPGFRQPGQGVVEERDLRPLQIERRQSTETIEQQRMQPPSVERGQRTETTEQRTTQPPPVTRGQSTETVEERDIRAPQPVRPSEGTTEAPSQTTTVTTETRSAPEQAGSESAETRGDRKSSKHAKTNRSPKRETASESHADQATSPEPESSDTAPAPKKPRKEKHAVASPPPPLPTASGSSEAPAAKPAEPAKAPPPPPREQKREATAAPAQQQQSAGSSEAPAKPVIRWVDPPPSK